MSKGKETARGRPTSVKDVAVVAASKKPKANGIHQGRKGGQGALSSKPGESSSTVHNKETTSNGDELADDELMQSLQRHDASFTALLSLIPAHLYLAPESDSEEDDDAEEEEASTHGKANAKKRKQDAKAQAAERKARIREAKRAKLDPDNQKSAVEVQQERAAKRAERRAASAGMNAADQDTLSLSFSMLKNDDEDVHAGDTDSGFDDSGDSDDEKDEDEDDDGDSYETLPTSAKGSEELNDALVVPSPPPGTGPPSIMDLRARLQAKIHGMQAQRRAPFVGGAGSSDTVNSSVIGDDESTASTKDELLDERRKKRGEMRDNRRKAAKERKRAEREQLGNGKKGASNAGNDRKGASGTSGSAPALFVSPGGDRRGNGSNAGSSATTNGNSDFAFSSLQFDRDDERLQKKSKHALPSDPKAALAILEARKRKDEARKAKHLVRSTDDDGDDSTARPDDSDRTEHARWSKAEAAAQGVKIRDDEQLLRKAAKKRDKLKNKSANEWKKRARDLSSQQAARAKKRSDNISARKERKMKGGSKSGSGNSVKGKALGGKAGGSGNRKARAGFEGKPRSFGGGGKSSRGGGRGGRGGGRGGGGRGGGGGRS